MKLVLSALLFFSSWTSHAFILDADKFADQFVWQGLMDKVAAEGEVSYSFISELRALTKIVDIETGKSHQAIYLTTSGRTAITGEYIILEVSLTTETWNLMEDGKTWVVDQWFYYLTAKGDFRYAVHNIITKEDVTVKKIENAPLGTVEEQEATVKHLLTIWE